MRQHNGRPYFIDHINRRSTYDDPRVAAQVPASVPVSVAPVAAQPTTSTPGVMAPAEGLPPGWEMRYHNGIPYFIDHVNKRSTYDDPRAAIGVVETPVVTPDQLLREQLKSQLSLKENSEENSNFLKPLPTPPPKPSREQRKVIYFISYFFLKFFLFFSCIFPNYLFIYYLFIIII